MVARAYTVAFEGVEARMVEVQCAVAAGLPWADGLAGLTRVPAEAFGVAAGLAYQARTLYGA